MTDLPVAGPPRPRSIGRVHWLGVATLMRRELRRFVLEGLETVVARAFAVLLWFIVFAAALGSERETPAGEALLTFIVPGIVLYAVIERAAHGTAFSLLYDKMEGMITDVVVTPLSPSEMTASYAISGTISALVSGVAVVAVMMVAWPLPVASPAAILLFAAGGGLLMALWGILVGLWADKWDHVAAAHTFFLMPVAFLSGMFTPFDQLPPALQAFVQVNPIYYAIDGFRYGFLGTAETHLGLAAAIIAATNASLWLICDRLFRIGYKIRA